MRKGSGKAQAFLLSIQEQEGCISWPYSTNRLGYGTVAYLGKSWLAHRAVYHLKHGVVPALLRHTCDNPTCVNPAHLIPGTPQDNMNDMVERGRSCGGERRATLLSAEDVQTIRAVHVRGTSKWNPGNTAVLATKYGVSKDYLRELVRDGSTKWPSLKA